MDVDELSCVLLVSVGLTENLPTCRVLKSQLLGGMSRLAVCSFGVSPGPGRCHNRICTPMVFPQKLEMKVDSCK